jgi:hypothetical protein
MESDPKCYLEGSRDPYNDLDGKPRMTIKYPQPILFLAGFLILLGCQKSVAPVSAATEEVVTSNCVKTAGKMLDHKAVPQGLTKSVVSHYDPKTNHCYVALEVETADVTKFDDYHARLLYDGQTGELLAYVEHKKGIKSGYLKGASNPRDSEVAVARIDELIGGHR